MNKKGFTLVELLGVIVILALVVGGGVFGIIKLIEKSRGESASISVESIKKATIVYSAEKENDDNYWKTISRKGYEGKYFCVTVEELINKGLLSKDKELGDISPYTYVGIKKDSVTLVKDNPVLLNNIKLEEENLSNIEKLYGVCTGNIINENISSFPTLTGGTGYTDEIESINFTIAKGEYVKVKEIICEYGITSTNLNKNGKISGNTCNLDNLKDNTQYYIRICNITENDSTACSDTISKTTAKIKGPAFNLTDKLTITYNKDNIKGDSYYYFKSSMNATSNVNVSSCTLNNDNTFNCNNDNTTNINSNAWYKTTNKDIELTYNASGKVNIVARTYDKSNNYAESKKDFNVYKAIFKKGSVDKIGNGTTDITKMCLADISGTCSIKSPTIEKLGYNVVGWNTNANATTSSWNANTNKNNVNGTYYPIVKAKAVQVTFHRNTSAKDATTVTKTFTYGKSGQKFNDNGWTNTGHTMTGWEERQPDKVKNYNVNAEVKDTWIDSRAPKIDLYAVWSPNTYTISYNANGGSGAPTAQTKTYGTDLTLTTSTPTRSGYTFDGWNTKSDGSGTNYSAGGKFTTNANTTLYAKWKQSTYTLRYNDNGGSGCSTKTKTITKGSKLGTLCRPSRSGYWYFEGWYYNGTKYTEYTKYNDNSDLTLTAHWYYNEPEPEPEPDLPCTVTTGLYCRSGPGTNYSKVGSGFDAGDRVAVDGKKNGWYYITDSTTDSYNCYAAGNYISCPSSGGGGSSGGGSSSKTAYCSLPSKLIYNNGELLAIGGMQVRNKNGVCESADQEKYRNCFSPTIQSRLFAKGGSDKTITINVSCNQIYKSFSFTVKVKCCNSLGEKNCNSAEYCKWQAGFCRDI